VTGELDAALAGAELLGEEEIVWPNAVLRRRAYLLSRLPPLELVTSVRCIVLDGEQALVVFGARDTHIVPGGRREPDETPEQTARREVLEETGRLLGPLTLVGCFALRHLAEPPPDHPRREFLQLVYVAEAVGYDAGALEHDPADGESAFMPLEQVRALPISPLELALLKRARQLHQAGA